MPAKGGIDTNQIVHWLASQQLPNSSFDAHISTSLNPFESVSRHETTFFTSLILVCLQNIDGASSISKRAAKFLKSQQSQVGSWNYWDRQATIAQESPFPDDLDDTACALLALSLHEPATVGGDKLANLANLLVANEEKPGGPYRTWLVPTGQKGWDDTDLVVNANIGSLLAHHGVSLPGLQKYVDTQLAAGRLDSQYYVGEIPAVYFLSRWYRGAGLRQRVNKYLRRLDQLTAMETAMLVTAACRLGTRGLWLDGAYKKLLQARVGDSWPPAALYIEFIKKSVTYYAGSPALTTALALEAINLYNQPTKEPVAKKPPQQSIYKAALDTSAGLSSGLRQHYLKIAKALTTNDKQGQITDMAGLTAQVFGIKISPKLQAHLNLASLDGWIAYTIYDDFYDQEAQPSDLAVANHALRQAIYHYQAALPKNTDFKEFVFSTLDTIDAANYWEVTHARAKMDNGLLQYELPNYGNHKQLAQRSLGHMLSALGVLLDSGEQLDGPRAKHMQKFFYHYLIARQLNDDAHDWLDDLRRGHLSAVVVMLLAGYKLDGPLDLHKELKDVQVYYWQYAIADAGALINQHLLAARQALKASGAVQPQVMSGWLDGLQAATQQAVSGSREAQKFIKTYKKTS